jgi:orotate phosphoribosyltransferase
MTEYKKSESFVEILLNANVLKFGDFVTKSGRNSPYFFNTGNIDSGLVISEVATYYAESIREHFGTDVTNLFGPAYKGIPLCVAVSEKLANVYGKDVSFTYNRKEAKDHGEGGTLVGHDYAPGDKVVIVEDVLTGGTSIRETMEIFKTIDVEVVGAIVGIDRQEKGKDTSNTISARKEVEQYYGIPVVSIVNLDSIVDSLHNKEVAGKVWIDDSINESIKSYRSKYGA